MNDTATENVPTTETKVTKGKAPKKGTKAKAAAPKTKAPKAAKPKREKTPKAPRESREGWGTFALRLPIPERDAFHAAAGPSAASRVARTVLVAFANEDEAAFKAALAEARKLRA